MSILRAMQREAGAGKGSSPVGWKLQPLALVVVCASVLCGCACPLVDMRRIYIVPMYGAGDNVVTVPVDVTHANQIEAKVADRLTGVQGAEISGNTASAGVSKGAVKASLK